MKKEHLFFGGSLILLVGTLIGWNAAHRDYERQLLRLSANHEVSGLVTVLGILHEHEAGRTNFMILGIRGQLEAHADSLESVLNRMPNKDRTPDYFQIVREARKYLSEHSYPGQVN